MYRSVFHTFHTFQERNYTNLSRLQNQPNLHVTLELRLRPTYAAQKLFFLLLDKIWVSCFIFSLQKKIIRTLKNGSSWNLYFMSFCIVYIVHVFFCPWLLCFIGKGLIHHMQSLLTIKEKLDPPLPRNNSFSWQWGVLYFKFYEFYGEQDWRSGECARPPPVCPRFDSQA